MIIINIVRKILIVIKSGLLFCVGNIEVESKFCFLVVKVGRFCWGKKSGNFYRLR